MKKIKLLVALHKKYNVSDDTIYLPVQVGAYGKDDLGYVRDDSGKNISNKNPYFCELTALYWAWKNLKKNDADYIGLCHYRRYFTLDKKKRKTEKERFENVLTFKQAEKILKTTDVILPKKRNYIIDNLYDHYKHTMHIEPLEITGKIIKNKYPEYYVEFNKLHKRTSAHMFNMFIMKRSIFDDYMKWLFDILFELEKQVDENKYDSFHARFYGRISELLLDVYLNTNNINYKEVKVVDMQGVNWYKKGTSFLKAKFLGKKYDKSF
jgi:hypothetical protein